ncbi:hypothetical protein LTR16_000022 [Cryomyces antarcticus]|uniref:Uncharacterized protein n=1 Tax=Cryomyces antarcticus TaxID=329879 RepID=A0ABR0KV11_9PEZI|nr:hypothetical protein LTR39_000003 [Cryomyces antarcticus]KAK5132142.1 hypothetical protein LTR16_000022 [Cryomyces antarcticus]
MGDARSHNVVRYSVPAEAQKLLSDGILTNALIMKSLHKEIQEYGTKIKFEGSEEPSIPVNWRFAESISALKALEGCMINLLLVRKYGTKPQEIVINTDHAQLFVMSTLLWTIDPKGEKLSTYHAEQTKYFPSWDIHNQQTTLHRDAVTNIYKTKDQRYFHLHGRIIGSMNPEPTLDSIGLPHNMEAKTKEDAWKPFMEKISQIDSSDMQHRASDTYRQAGTICWTTDEYKQSVHGKANSHVGLFEIHEHPNPSQSACWWPDSPQTSAKRPLAGLKVVDITRVIAAPAIGRGLAELGASVMRVTAPHLVDYSSLHCDLNWGKWNTCLDFRKEEDRSKLKQLILEADVLITGYRPGVLEKWGLGKIDIVALCRERGRGIVFAQENCYGWNGPWAGRSGWQQISDAVRNRTEPFTE